MSKHPRDPITTNHSIYTPSNTLAFIQVAFNQTVWKVHAPPRPPVGEHLRQFDEQLGASESMALGHYLSSSSMRCEPQGARPDNYNQSEAVCVRGLALDRPGHSGVDVTRARQTERKRERERDRRVSSLLAATEGGQSIYII